MNDFDRRWAITMIRATGLAIALLLLVALIADVTR